MMMLAMRMASQAMIYKVNVEGMGTVYEGPNHRRASDEFYYYSRESRTGLGNAAGKPVTFEPSVGSATRFDPQAMTEIPKV